MKKTLLFVCLLLTALLSGCVAAADDFVSKTYDFDAAGLSALHIDVRDRKIEVERSPDSALHILCWESEKEGYEFAADEAGTLRMTLKTDKRWTDFFGAAPEKSFRTIRLQLPDGGVEALSLYTTNEDVSLPAVRMESLRISVNGGSLTLDGVDAGDIELSTKNGNLSGTLAGKAEDYRLRCSVKKGDSNQPDVREGGSRSLVASVNNGDLSIRFAGD